MPFGKSGMVIFFNIFMVFNTNAGFYLEKIADV
jgi:hypothetical protein